MSETDQMRKLFYERRLTPTRPNHLEFIKGELARMKSSDEVGYKDMSDHYEIGVKVKVTKEPEVTKTETTEVPADDGEKIDAPKKRGRPEKTA